MDPLHICYICNEYPPAPHGGIGSFTQVIARCLVARGHRVTVAGVYPEQWAKPEPELDEGVQVLRLSRRGIPLLRFLTNRRKLSAALKQLHAQHPIDVLEGGELEMAMLSHSAPGTKVLRMHGGPTFFETGNRFQMLKERWAFSVADEICAVSNSVADGTRRMLKMADRHIEVIYNPIETKVFAPSSGDLPEEDGLVVFVGTVAERKGIRQLIQAMTRIVAEAPQVRLEIYGGEIVDPAPPRPLKDELIALMPPEVASHVVWKGRVPRTELPRAIQRASLCVYPSHFEAMPIAWLEGLASGKAVVASCLGPGPEVIEDGETGLLCDPREPDSIASAVIRALQDADLRRHLGANARRDVEQRFELEAIMDQNEAYYRRLASK